MQSPQKTGVVLFVSALLLLIAGALAMLGVRAEHRRREQDARLHAGWRQDNVASLKMLSAVRGLSADELGRVTRAGDDPEQLRQALIEIHELRLAYASHDLEDAEQRKAELGSAAGYTVYADRPQQADLVALVNQDEWAATSQIALYASALSRIRAWQPVSYGQYMARRSASPLARASTLPPVTIAREKPDPRVPLRRAAAGPGGSATSVAVQAPLPRQAEIAQAARHPTLTVYADDAPVQQQSSGVTDLDERMRNEAAIRGTLARWSHAMVLNDPHAESAEYSPHLDRYFLRRNVDKAFVEADKAAYLRRGNLTASFALQDVRFENETENAADVRLVKDVAWQRSSSGVEHKLIRSRLHLVRTSAGWKIAGEQDFR